MMTAIEEKTVPQRVVDLILGTELTHEVEFKNGKETEVIRADRWAKRKVKTFYVVTNLEESVSVWDAKNVRYLDVTRKRPTVRPTKLLDIPFYGPFPLDVEDTAKELTTSYVNYFRIREITGYVPYAQWDITVSKTHLTIGCQKLTWAIWSKTYEDIIRHKVTEGYQPMAMEIMQEILKNKKKIVKRFTSETK